MIFYLKESWLNVTLDEAKLKFLIKNLTTMKVFVNDETTTNVLI